MSAPLRNYTIATAWQNVSMSSAALNANVAMVIRILGPTTGIELAANVNNVLLNFAIIEGNVNIRMVMKSVCK